MSSSILSTQDFGLKIYNRFPPKYRADDIRENFALRRYLEACADGGFSYTIDEWNGILDFPNADKVDETALPALYEQYGFDLFHGIPEEYLRYFLPRLGTAWSKKGSIDVIEYVVSSLSGIKTDTNVYEDEQGNTCVDVRLEMDVAMGDYFPDPVQFERILDKFLPFYIKKRLIYVFIFADSATLHGTDGRYDRVVIGKKVLYIDALNTWRTFNNDFILNATNVEGLRLRATDTLVGLSIDTKYYDHGSFIHSSDANFEDFVSVAPQEDTPELHGTDSRYDYLTIGKIIKWFNTLNVGHFNSSFILNYTNMEMWSVHGTDSEEHVIGTKYSEQGAFDTDTDLITGSRVYVRHDDGGEIVGADSRHDHLTIDKIFKWFNTLNNTDFNSSFILNYSNMDTQDVVAVDSEVSISHKGVYRETGLVTYSEAVNDQTYEPNRDDASLRGEETISDSHNTPTVDSRDLDAEDDEKVMLRTVADEACVITFAAIPAMMGLFTNANSMLNTVRLNVPDAVDLVTVSGETTAFYPDCKPL